MNPVPEVLKRSIDQVTKDSKNAYKEMLEDDSSIFVLYMLGQIRALESSIQIMRLACDLMSPNELDNILQYHYDISFIALLITKRLSITQVLYSNSDFSLDKIRYKGSLDGYKHVVSVLENIDTEVL